MSVYKIIVANLIFLLTLTACASNPSVNASVDTAGVTTPPINSNSFIYRSPPTAALQAHGLAR